MSPFSSVRRQKSRSGCDAAPERQHDGQRDLALAEIVAGVFAELGRGAAVVERVVDQLEGDPEVHPIRPQAATSALPRPASIGPTSQAAAKRAAVFARMTAR